MILHGVGHQISCLGVCYANDPQKGGYATPVHALDLTTSLRGDFTNWQFTLHLHVMNDVERYVSEEKQTGMHDTPKPQLKPHGNQFPIWTWA